MAEAAASDTASNSSSLSVSPELVDTLIAHGKQVAFAVLILIAGWMISRWLGAFAASRIATVTKGDLTIPAIFGKIVRIAGLVLTIIVVLGQFGVQTTSLVALIGAAGLTIGLALQGTLSNVAAGVMLLIFRPFKVGDVIDTDGVVGKVLDIGLFITELNTPDNIRVILPNSRIWGNQIKNIVANPTRRLDLVFSISYGDDMEKAKGIVREVLAGEKRILADPAPMIVVGQFGDSSVDLFIRPWVNTAEYWDVRFALLQGIKQAFDEKGITIPFPQRDVHLHQAS